MHFQIEDLILLDSLHLLIICVSCSKLISVSICHKDPENAKVLEENPKISVSQEDNLGTFLASLLLLKM